MRRWNGWGDDAVTFALPREARGVLEDLVGRGTRPTDATLEEVVAQVPPTRLPSHPLVSTDPELRVRHSRGQSLPDWIATRSGRVGAVPDGVARPSTPEEVRELLGIAREWGASVIPYGGGTSVVGHINPPGAGPPVVTVDMGRISRLERLDDTSGLATFGAGVTGPALEEELRRRGLTLGHFPQSFELSTLGGWVASRSSGQQSLRYGRIERLFAGGKVETPAGTLEIPPFPASAAGPDLREVVLGSEGRLGIVTEATVRTSPLPEIEEFHAFFFPEWEPAFEAARQVAQARLPLSMVRLSTSVETATNLALAGHRWLVSALKLMLRARGSGESRCMLLVGATGQRRLVAVALAEVADIVAELGGVHTGQRIGRAWLKNRFRSAYLRNTLWEMGYAVDTLETAVSWSQVQATIDAIEKGLRSPLADEQEKVHVFTHLSHLYPWGSSIYTTYLFRIARDPEETLRRFGLLKAAASEAIVQSGGTISHQHGVGADHLPYLKAEKGALGTSALGGVLRLFDPDGMMNPGKLV